MAVFVALAGGAFRVRSCWATTVTWRCLHWPVGRMHGFPRFNHYPALVFMGDTGSMFIGGAMVGMAMLLRMPLYMILICFTLIASSMSVIIQRVYFKVTHGKRIFKMSPIHHHFELSGMTEVQIVAMYAVVVGCCQPDSAVFAQRASVIFHFRWRWFAYEIGQ